MLALNGAIATARLLGLGGRNQIEVCEVALIFAAGRFSAPPPFVSHCLARSRRRAIRRTPASPSKNANCRCASTGSPASRIAEAGSARSASSPRTARRDFDEFARGRQLAGATIVLDSSGGSVNDSIALGRRFRSLGALTTVGVSVRTQTAHGERASVTPEAYCESMCVFLLLSGKTRYVPDGGACPRAPDLDGRPRRRRQGRELHRAGPDDRRARHRPSRQIHLRHGRRRRSAVAGAERAAVGRSARIVARPNCG